MTKILITEFINENSLNNLKKNFQVLYDQELWNQKDKLINSITDFEGLIVRNKTEVTKDLLDKAYNLKFVGRLGVGLDNIDVKYCKNKEIFVQPATGMNADSKTI